MSDAATPTQYTVLLYSDDAAVRAKIRLAIGPRPAADLSIEFVDASTWVNGSKVMSTSCSNSVVARARSWSFQKPADAISSSRRVSVSRFASRSKIPPEL